MLPFGSRARSTCNHGDLLPFGDKPAQYCHCGEGSSFVPHATGTATPPLSQHARGSRLRHTAWCARTGGNLRHIGRAAAAEDCGVGCAEFDVRGTWARPRHLLHWPGATLAEPAGRQALVRHTDRLRFSHSDHQSGNPPQPRRHPGGMRLTSIGSTDGMLFNTAVTSMSEGHATQFPHGVDIGVRGAGNTRAVAFAQAAAALAASVRRTRNRAAIRSRLSHLRGTGRPVGAVRLVECGHLRNGGATDGVQPLRRVAAGRNVGRPRMG